MGVQDRPSRPNGEYAADRSIEALAASSQFIWGDFDLRYLSKGISK